MFNRAKKSGEKQVIEHGKIKMTHPNYIKVQVRTQRRTRHTQHSQVAEGDRPLSVPSTYINPRTPAIASLTLTRWPVFVCLG